MRWRREPSKTVACDEAATILAAQSDVCAFAPLYERYADPVYQYALHRLGDPDAAADVTSQTFVRALAALPRYRSGSFRSWLFAIAHNTIVDAGPRAKSSDAIPEGWDIPDPDPSPEDVALGMEAQERLSVLLACLTPEQREVVELHLAGYTSREIAQRLSRGVSAVRSLQWRAFARLRQALMDVGALDALSYQRKERKHDTD